jgi:hypothetical protein
MHPGLCASCTHAQVITSSRQAVFHLCRLSFTDPRFRKYPPLPVVSCAGYELQRPSATSLESSNGTAFD